MKPPQVNKVAIDTLMARICQLRRENDELKKGGRFRESGTLECRATLRLLRTNGEASYKQGRLRGLSNAKTSKHATIEHVTETRPGTGGARFRSVVNRVSLGISSSILLAISWTAVFM